jgi:hypothetical protein
MKLLEVWIQTPKSERQEHLVLIDECLERGGNSTVHKGVLAQYLNTDIPQGNNRIQLCHACHNDGCSNPKHLYWGTATENHHDAVENGIYPKNTKSKSWNTGKGGYKLNISEESRERRRVHARTVLNKKPL